MKTNEYINKHIQIDCRERISKKLKLLSEKHIEFGRQLNLIQKEAVGIIFSILNAEGFIFKGMVNDVIKNNSYNHYINTLLVENFIKIYIPNKEVINQITSVYNDYVANKVVYYKLTPKGNDFIKINYVKEYLNSEYEDLIYSLEDI